ncbi:MAG TPA: hypothetical protein VF407_22330, partial [Polyangiaceae bacterium]
MLPFQKRTVSNSQAEDLSSDDIVEVVHKVRHAASLAPAAKLNSTMRSAQRRDLPEIPAPVPAPRKQAPMARFEEHEEEEEMTCLMPAKGLLIPAGQPMPRRSSRETSTSFRPMPNSIPRAPLYSAHESTPLDKRTASQRMAYSTPQPMAVLAARQQMVPKAPASLAPMAMPSAMDSEPHIHAGATVLTARTLKSRPTMSWAAALVAMGIFAGLVTAAVARGDFSGNGDAKVASASAQSIGEQVIPSQPASSPAPVYTASNAPSMAIASPVVMPTPMSTGVVAAPVLAVAPAAPAKAVHVAAVSHPVARASAPKAAAPVAAPAVDKTEKAEVAVADKPEK